MNNLYSLFLKILFCKKFVEFYCLLMKKVNVCFIILFDFFILIYIKGNLKW